MAQRCDFVALDDSDPTQARAPRQGTMWYWTMTLANFDAAGVVAHMELRKSYRDEDVALDCTELNGRLVWLDRGSTVTDATLQFRVDADDMSDVPARKYVYDMEFTPGGIAALAYATIYGDVQVMPEVTK